MADAPSSSLAAYVPTCLVSGSTHSKLELGQTVALPDPNTQPEDSTEWSTAWKKRKFELISQPIVMPVADEDDDSPTMTDLLESGMLAPGRATVTVTYKGYTYTADLLKDGTIQYDERPFATPSAFSLHVKRMTTPAKTHDDGWRSVSVDGATLDEWRKRYRKAQGIPDPEPGSAARAGVKKAEAKATAAAASAGGAAAAAEEDFEEPAPGEDSAKWVQCSRCEQWRVVPDELYPAIEADPRDDWFCEDAKWNVTTTHPFTTACERA